MTDQRSQHIQLDADIERADVVVIAGNQRSGTSLLARLLDGQVGVLSFE